MFLFWSMHLLTHQGFTLHELHPQPYPPGTNGVSKICCIQWCSQGGTWVLVLPRRSWKFFQSILFLLCWIFMYFVQSNIIQHVSPASGGIYNIVLYSFTLQPDSRFWAHFIHSDTLYSKFYAIYYWIVCFSGFAFVRPTPASISLYMTAWELYVKYHKAHDQTYINLAIERANWKTGSAPVVQIHSLPHSQFPCGIYYFEHQHRMFENKPPCLQCVMVHNNYMGSVAAKVPQHSFTSFV